MEGGGDLTLLPCAFLATVYSNNEHILFLAVLVLLLRRSRLLVVFLAVSDVHFASATLLLSFSSLWKLIEAGVSHFAFFSPLVSLLLLLLVQHPRTFLLLLPVLVDLIILCVSSRIMEMEEMNYIIILLTYIHRTVLRLYTPDS